MTHPFDNYNNADRHYHNDRHIIECLKLLNKVLDLDPNDRYTLAQALTWHDVIYDPRASDNEEKSAAVADLSMKKQGFRDDLRKEVCRLILLTKDHVVAADDHRGAIMVSIDLAILGAEPADYDEYSKAIRKEYAHISDKDYRVGRTGILFKLLDRAPLYPRPEFQERYGDTAKFNMKREIIALHAQR